MCDTWFCQQIKPLKEGGNNFPCGPILAKLQNKKNEPTSSELEIKKELQSSQHEDSTHRRSFLQGVFQVNDVDEPDSVIYPDAKAWPQNIEENYPMPEGGGLVGSSRVGSSSLGSSIEDIEENYPMPEGKLFPVNEVDEPEAINYSPDRQKRKRKLAPTSTNASILITSSFPSSAAVSSSTIMGNSQPSTIEKYKKLQILVKDGNGIVYKAQDIKTKKLYAVKFSERKFSDDEDRRISNFKNCPYICECHETFLYEKKIEIGNSLEIGLYWCVVLKYYEQGNLRNRIEVSKEQNSLTGKSSNEDELQIIDWMLQLSRGVCALHRENLIHRDLNPSNIFLDDDHIKIGDFGIATDKNTLSFVGTLGYYAPEIWKGEISSTKVDMYSLGSLLLDLLTLSFAPDRTSQNKARIKLIPRTYSAKWVPIVEALLHEDSTKRWSVTELATSILELLELLQKYVENEEDNKVYSLDYTCTIPLQVNGWSIQRTPNKHRCLQCNKTFTRASGLRKHLPKHNSSRFQCNSCKKKFRTKTNLTAHKRVCHFQSYTGVNSGFGYSCGLCPHSAPSKAALVRHERSHSKNPRPYACGHCPKKYTDKSSLEKHIECMHPEKPIFKEFVCAVCGQGFTRASVLKRHANVHTKEILYPCGNCDQGFYTKASLLTHQKTHQRITSYTCPQCGQQLASARNLSKHWETVHGNEQYDIDDWNELSLKLLQIVERLLHFPLRVKNIIIDYCASKLSSEINLHSLDPLPTDHRRVAENKIFGENNVVYRATYQGSPVAVTVIEVPLVQGVIQKLRTLADLNHPNLPFFYGFYFDMEQGRFYLVMELATKGTLFDIIQSTKLDWKTRVSIALDICNGLLALQNKKIQFLHQNLKCQNILIRQDLSAFLGDFGLVTSHPRKDDLFSFGIMLYELVQGTPPKDCPSDYLEVMQECQSQEPKKRLTVQSLIERLKVLKVSVSEIKRNDEIDTTKL